MQQEERCPAPANSLNSEASPPTDPQEAGSLLRRKVTVPACWFKVAVVTALFLSEELSKSLSGTPPGHHPLPGLDYLATRWLLSDLSVGSLGRRVMGAAGG